MSLLDGDTRADVVADGNGVGGSDFDVEAGVPGVAVVAAGRQHVPARMHPLSPFGSFHAL